MKPIGNNIIIRSEVDQKEYVQYGTLKLIIPFRAQLSENGKQSNPVLAEVIAVNDTIDLVPGDKIILGHNTISNKAWLISMEENIALLSIPVDRWVLGKIGEHGELIPLHGNCVAERIGEALASSIIIIPDSAKKTERNKVKILSVSPDENKIPVGCTAIVHTYSDYEIFWNSAGIEKSAIIVWREDIVAVA